MKLAKDWRKILRYAWSVRMFILAGIFSGVEGILWIVPLDWFPVPRGWLTAAAFGASALGFWFRLLAQREFDDEE